MPMLHNCAFAGCSTLTLSTYCWEHEVFIRRELEAERTQATARSGASPPSSVLDDADSARQLA